MLTPEAARASSEYALLSSYLSNDSSITDLDVIRNLTKATAQTYRAGDDAEGCLWRLWCSFIWIAIDTPPDQQGPIVEILRGIQQRPNLTGGDLSDCKVWGLRVWKDLPAFGASCRETVNTVRFDTPEAVNFCAFLARITSVYFENTNLKPFNFSLYAIWTFRDAFEESQTSPDPSSYLVQASRQWMLYSGDGLRARSVEGYEFHNRVAFPGNAYEDREWRGFNPERWQMWMEKMQIGGGEDELVKRSGNVGTVSAPTIKAA